MLETYNGWDGQMVRHPVTEGVSSPPIGSTLEVQMKRGPYPKQARVGLQREPGMVLVQELAGAAATGSSADIRMSWMRPSQLAQKDTGGIRQATTSILTTLLVPGPMGKIRGCKNSVPFRRTLGPWSP